jgi:hypothetical protein
LLPRAKSHESQSTGSVAEKQHTGQNGDFMKVTFFPQLLNEQVDI